MLQARKVTKGSQAYSEVKELYSTSFPANEQAPLWLLLRKARHSFIHFIAFYDADQFAGFTYYARSQDLIYVLYLAVNTALHSKGYGSRMLRYIEEHDPGCRLALEIEIVDETADNYEQRMRRKTFYVKNGFTSSGLASIDAGVEYEILVKNGSCTVDEFAAAQKLVSGNVLYCLFRPKLFVIMDKQENNGSR